MMIFLFLIAIIYLSKLIFLSLNIYLNFLLICLLNHFQKRRIPPTYYLICNHLFYWNWLRIIVIVFGRLYILTRTYHCGGLLITQWWWQFLLRYNLLSCVFQLFHYLFSCLVIFFVDVVLLFIFKWKNNFVTACLLCIKNNLFLLLFSYFLILL